MFVDVIEQIAQAQGLTSSWVQDNSKNERLMLLLPRRDILKRTRVMSAKPILSYPIRLLIYYVCLKQSGGWGVAHSKPKHHTWFGLGHRKHHHSHAGAGGHPKHHLGLAQTHPKHHFLEHLLKLSGACGGLS